VPVVAEGQVEQVALWVQVLLGAELVGPVYRGLNANDWMSRKQRLETLGGTPLP